MSNTSSQMDTSEGLSQEMVIQNRYGLHARPASKFVKLAGRFKCSIYVEKDGEEVNGKSIMGLMMLAAGEGSHILVKAAGEDAREALDELQKLVDGKFDED
ncbi:MAG: HPr family phosphocarrier protein [Limisphaerales bacterium]